MAIDVSEVRGAAVTVAGHGGAVAGGFHVLRAGMIPAMRLEASGASLADAMRATNIQIAGHLHEGKLFVPGLALDLSNVHGVVAMSGGILAGKDLGALLGGITARDGRLTFGLEGDKAPFHLASRRKRMRRKFTPCFSGS